MKYIYLEIQFNLGKYLYYQGKQFENISYFYWLTILEYTIFLLVDRDL